MKQQLLVILSAWLCLMQGGVLAQPIPSIDSPVSPVETSTTINSTPDATIKTPVLPIPTAEDIIPTTTSETIEQEKPIEKEAPQPTTTTAESPAKPQEQLTTTGFVVGDKQWGGPFVNTLGTIEPPYKDFKDLHYEIDRCVDFKEQLLKDNTGGTLNYYFSTPDYNEFKGVDLVPELKDLYLRSEAGGSFYLNNLNFRDARAFTEPPRVKTCTIDSDEPGWKWTVQHVGPFESTGNYDWWQFGYADFGNFKEVLAENPGGIYIDAQNLAPVLDGTRERLEYPPVHIHHVHAVPDPSGLNVHTRTTFAAYNFSLMLEQHGDYQCTAELGGMDCLMTKMPPGMGKFFDVPLSVDGELNDVRPPRSEKMRWWFEMAVRWTADPKLVPQKISFMGIASPGIFDINQQLTYVITYRAPTDGEAMLWYSGKMWTDGKMIANRIHSHSSIFHSIYFINASPHELGLDDPKFMPSRTYQPFYIKDLGFESIRDLATWILDHLDNDVNKQKLKAPRLICRAHVSAVVKNGFIYDRRPADQCRDFEFKEGDDFTVVAFTKHEGYPAGAHLPDVIPEYIPNHAVWGMYYVDYKQKYFNDFIQFSQTGMVFSNKEPMWFIDVLMMALIYGGVVQASVKNTVHAIAVPIALVILFFIGYAVYRYKKLSAYWKEVSSSNPVQARKVEYSKLTQEDDEERESLIKA